MADSLYARVGALSSRRSAEGLIQPRGPVPRAVAPLHLVNARDAMLVHNTFSANNYGAVFLSGSHYAVLLNNAFMAPIAAAGELPTTFGFASGNCATYGNSLPPMPITGGGPGPAISDQCRAVTTSPVNAKTVPGFPKNDVTGRAFPATPVPGAYQ